MKELVNGGVEVWHRFTDLIRPGNTIEQIEQSVDDIIEGHAASSEIMPEHSFRIVPMRAWAGRTRLLGRERLSPIKLSWAKSGPIAGAPTRGRPGA
jgi:hypothetical protein